ncbi:MAG: PAS domain-containing protein [Bacteroidales bacterium]|nr:PAS domain-containing protein [Bacteroidales bacterium]
MLGYENNEFEGSYENWRKIVHPDDLEYCENSIKNHIENQKTLKSNSGYVQKQAAGNGYTAVEK